MNAARINTATIAEGLEGVDFAAVMRKQNWKLVEGRFVSIKPTNAPTLKAANAAPKAAKNVAKPAGMNGPGAPK